MRTVQIKVTLIFSPFPFLSRLASSIAPHAHTGYAGFQPAISNRGLLELLSPVSPVSPVNPVSPVSLVNLVNPVSPVNPVNPVIPVSLVILLNIVSPVNIVSLVTLLNLLNLLNLAGQVILLFRYHYCTIIVLLLGYYWVIIG